MPRSVPNMPKSQERIAQEREFRRSRIADAAMRLFAEQGFSNVSVEQIAEASGYTRVSVYNHFRGKPMIYLYIVQRETEALADEVERALSPGMGSLEQFHIFLDRLIAINERQPSFFDLYFFQRERVEKDMSEEELAVLAAAHYRLEAVSRRLFERGIQDGTFRDVDPATATNLFFAGFAGAILLHRTHRFKATLRQLLQACGHFFLRSLGAAEGPYPLPVRKELPPAPTLRKLDPTAPRKGKR